MTQLLDRTLDTSNVAAGILIVDDEELLANEIKSLLQAHGYRSIACGSVSACFQHLESDPHIRVILMDVRLRTVSGLALINDLRREYADRPYLQFIVVTAHADSCDIREVVGLNVVDFITKPFDDGTLLRSIAIAMNRSCREIQRTIEQPGRLLEAKLDDAVAERQDRGDTSISKAVAEADHFAKKAVFSRYRFSAVSLDLLLTVFFHKDTRPLTVGDICLISGAPASPVIRKISELERHGFISREKDSLDERRTIICLTTTATEILSSYVIELDKRLAEIV